MLPFLQAVLLTKPTRYILSAPFQQIFVVLEDYFEYNAEVRILTL